MKNTIFCWRKKKKKKKSALEKFMPKAHSVHITCSGSWFSSHSRFLTYPESFDNERPVSGLGFHRLDRVDLVPHPGQVTLAGLAPPGLILFQYQTGQHTAVLDFLHAIRQHGTWHPQTPKQSLSNRMSMSNGPGANRETSQRNCYWSCGYYCSCNIPFLRVTRYMQPYIDKCIL